MVVFYFVKEMLVAMKNFKHFGIKWILSSKSSLEFNIVNYEDTL